jgi:ribosomal protein L24
MLSKVLFRNVNPIHYSNVMLLDGSKQTTRIGVKKIEQNGATARVRIARTTGEQI